MSAQDKATKFKEGEVYYARSICDYDTIIRVKIKRITPKMVKYVELDMWEGEEVKSRKVVSHETRQTFSAGAGFTVSSNNLSGSAECPKEIEPEVEAAATAQGESALDEYSDKEILITMYCPAKGHKVARLVSMDMFSIPYYDAKEDWECDAITADEGKRVELINRWISELANKQHKSILEFVKYEIVEEGTLSEYYLNWQFKLEAEKQDCEPAAEAAAEAELDTQEPGAAGIEPAGNREKPEEQKAELNLESNMTIDNPDYSLLEANGVWGGEFRGQWKYKIWYKNSSFFKSADKELALGHAVASYNEIPIAERIATKEEAYDKANRARYDKLDGRFGRYSMDELGDLMQKQKALSGSLFSGALNGMDARPFSDARNRSHRLRLSVGYVGEEIANLAFYMEERAKIEAQHQTA